MSVFVIAEVGVNHNGSTKMAMDLVRASADSGADAVKFQVFNTDMLVEKSARTAGYQSKNTGIEEQYKLLKKLEIDERQLDECINLCEKLNIEFMATAFDEAAIDLIVSKGVGRLKIPSGEISNYLYLEYIAKQDLPMLLSTGMSSKKEVVDAVSVISRVRQDEKFEGGVEEVLSVLHCTSNYPAGLNEINLNVIPVLKKELGCDIGYSDHSEGYMVAPLAVAVGASVIEKHITLDKTLSGPDHKASLEPDEFGIMVDLIRSAEIVLGSSVKKASAEEDKIRPLVRRSVTLARDMKKGERIHKTDLRMLRPEKGIPASAVYEVVGKSVCRNLEKGRFLDWGDIE